MGWTLPGVGVECGQTMFHPGAFLPQLLAEAHIELHVDWSRFALTIGVFVGLAALAIYLETRNAQRKKK